MVVVMKNILTISDMDAAIFDTRLFTRELAMLS